MPLLVRTRLKPFQPICTFLYPRSCFHASPAAAQAKALPAITVSRPYTLPSSRAQRLAPPSRHDSSSNHRYFTTSTPNALPNGALFKPPKMVMSAGKSYKLQVKEEISRNGLPDDIGLFENTLIMPSGPSKPSIFTQPRLRRSLEWYRFKARLLDLARLLIYKFTMGKPRPQMGLWRTAAIAKALHAKTFRAFAEGDMTTLNSICTGNLRQHFARQIAARPAGTKYVWTVHRYLGWWSPRTVSNKAAIVAQGEASMGQRQVVVEIRSVQSLVKVKEGGETGGGEEGKVVVAGTEDQQRKCEYFVIQQRHVEGVGPGEWQVWGTVSQKGWEEILERAGYQEVLNAARGQKEVVGMVGK